MTANAIRRLANNTQNDLEIILPQVATSDATPSVVYTSAVDISVGRALVIETWALVYTATADAVSSIYKRGIYARATGGNLRLVDSAASSTIGEIIANRADIIYGTSGQRFTISVRGRAATSYNWNVNLRVTRNA